MRRLGVVTLLALGGCVYAFDNPVAAQAAGTVTGRVVLDGGAPGQTIAGAQVDLLWSDLSVELGQSGSFAFLDLPDGTYTLRYRVPPAGGNGFPIVGERLDVYLPFTGAGEPDTIALGDIAVDAAGEVEGNVVGQGAGVVVGAFAPDADGGVGEYEGYSTTTDATGHYALFLPAGDHQLWASTASQAGTLAVKLPAGQDLTGQDVSLQTPPFADAQLSGYVVLDPNGAHDSVADVQALVSGLAVDVTVVTAADPPYPAPTFAFQTPVPSQGVSAVQVTQTLPPGALYDVTCSLPAAGAQVPPVVLRDLPVIAGRTTLLRQIVLLRQATLDANHALPVDAGASPPDAGADAGGPADAGPLSWTLVGQIQDPGAVDAGPGADVLLPLPVPEGHELLFSESLLPPGAIEATTEPGDAGFAAPSVIWQPDGGLWVVSGSLVAATSGTGADNAAAWVVGNTGAFSVVGALQSDGGPWTPLAVPLPPPGLNNQPLALAYERASGVPWLAEVSSQSVLILVPLTGSAAGGQVVLPLPSSDGGVFGGSVALAPCTNPADAGSALCLAYTDLSTSLWVGVFDPAAQLVAFEQVFTASPGDILSGPAITDPVGGLTFGLVVGSDVIGSTSLVLGGLASGATPTLRDAGPASGSPALLDWSGEALVAYPSPGPSDAGPITAVEAADADAGIEPPPLPSSAGAGLAASGYVDPAGNLLLAVPDATHQFLQLYQLGP